MKSNFLSLRRGAAVVGQLVLLGWLGLNGQLARADDAPGAAAPSTRTVEADKAWRLVRKATQAPMPPEEWKDKEPTREEVGK